MPRLEHLEQRQLLAALPFHLDFGAASGGILDTDGQGTGFESIQPNTAGNQYQPALIDLDSAAGLLRLTTNGTSTTGGNSRNDNTLVNALQIAFDGTQTFEVRTKIAGGLSAISEGYEQAGIFLGPDQDNWIKLVAIWHVGDGGPRLEFADEYSDGAGSTTSTITNGRVFVANWNSVSTLDLRLVCNPTTGVVTAHYKLNGAANWSQVPHSITVPSEKRSLFFTTAANAGVIQFDKSNAQNFTVSYDSFTVERQAPASGPSVRSMRPTPGATNVLRDTFVAVDLNLPNGGLDPTTVNGTNVFLVNNATGQTVAATVNTTGGGDAITLTPIGLLAANTNYTFHVTIGVRDIGGAAFEAFTASFTTGTSVAESDPRIAFNRTIQAATVGIGWTGVTIGPDGKLYGVTHSGEIHRFDIAADGSLTNRTLLFNYETSTGTKRLITGIVFDVSQATLTAYVSHGQWVDPGNDQDRTAADWTGAITRFTGSNLQSRQDVIVGLPRSVYDHLNNQATFGPDGKLYFVMASNSAMGAPDSTWGNRPERLLSGTVLQADVRNISSTLDVKTEAGGTYDPFAAGAPVKIFATGIRNGWDLVWTSAGHLFAPANGSAAGGNTPAGPGNSPPAINGVTQTQNDYLFRVVQGGYYGHPNPLRGEYVLNGGNPTTGIDPAEVTQYPVGTLPPPSYRGFAYDFGRNVSPNGIVEYNSNGVHFGGALDGKLLVVRYSGGDDILIIDVAADGTVTRAYGGAFGMTGFTDPLDIIQHPTSGHLYVAEAGFRTDGGNPNGLRISLLKPIAPTTATVGSPRLLSYGAGPALHFSDVFGNPQPGLAHRITITNSGSSPLALPADAFSITGTGAARFSLAGVPGLPFTIAPGQSLNVDVLFTANAKGVVAATLTIKTNDLLEPTRTIGLRGLGTVGEGGSNEPSLQRILDLYQLPISVGDPDPETTDYPSQTSVAGSEEITMQVLRRAGGGPVRIELLASMGTANANAFGDTSALGYYNPSSGARIEVLRIPKTHAQTVNVSHSGGLTFEPAADFGLYGTFFDFGPRDTWSEDSRNTWESTVGERRKIRFFPLKDAGGAVVANAYVFAIEEFPNATDQNDIVGVIYNLQPAGTNANVKLTNEDGVPFHDRLIFNRIRDLDATLPNLVHDVSKLTITNSGGQPLNITSITLNSADFQITAGGTGGGPVNLAPGASHTVTVRFVYNDASALGCRIRNGVLSIQSNDPDTPTQTIELRGLWQSDSENGNNALSQEPNLFELVQTLGYSIDVGPNTGRDHNSGTNTGGRVERIGSETLSAYWRRVDSGKPVEIWQVGAWHRQTPMTNTSTRWFVQGSHASPTFLFQHDAEYGQSLFPPKNNSTDPARASFNPGSNSFGLKVDGVFSDPALNAGAIDDGHGMRWYALYDRQGARIPDAWLVAQDYVGQSFSNYDYQDNAYIVFNAKPVSGPTAPVNLAASGTSGGNALSWARNTEGNLVGYNIYRSDSPTGTFTKLNASLVIGSGPSISFTDITAPAGVLQHYRVAPVDEHGTEGAFNTASATRPAGATVPAAPSGLVASTLQHDRVVITWVDNSSNETGFRIERALGTGAFAPLDTVVAGTTAFADNSVSAQTTYRYRVFAFNAQGDSATASNTITVTTPGDPAQIASPTNLRLTALEAFRVSLAWDDNADNETGFRVERAIGAGSFSLIATIGAPDVTSFADTTVQPDTQYRYRVVAFNTLASSGPSNTLVVTTPSDPTQIAAPTGLAATAPVATQVNLSWHDNSSNETAFVVERRLAASSTWQGIATVGVDAQSYIDTGASAATSYVYRVYARNAVAQSPFSNETSVTTPDAEIFISDNIGDATGSTTTVTPGMDIDVSATGSGMGGTSDNVRFVHRLIIGDFDYRVRVDAFSKADPAAAAGLMVRETTGGGARNVFLRTSGEVRLSYRDNPGGNTAELGLANPGLPVWLRLVRSGDVFTGYWSLTGTGWTQLAQATISMDVALRLGIAVASYSASTSTAAFRELGIVQELAPAAPADFSANAQGTHSVLLGWTDAAVNESGYRVERRDTGTSAWQTLIVLADGANQYTDASVVPGGEYDYRVLAFNGAGESASGVVSVDIPSDQPNAPANVTGRAAADRAGGVSLSWSSGGGEVAGYRVERRTLENGTAGSWQTVANVGGLATGLRDATATPGKGYQYRVVAIGESADSDPSTVVTVHTPQVALPGVGQPLLDPRVETFSETVARLVWADTAEGELGVRVQRRLAGGQWVDHALLPAESSGFIDRNLAPGANYEYRVRAEGDGVAGSWSGAVNIEMPFQAQWQHVAIGGINSGATSIRPGVHYDVSANGRDIGGTSDELGFVYRHVTGDFDYAVRVTRLAGADPGRMAGLMARASLGSGSANVYAKLLAGAAQLTNRQADDGATSASSALTTVNSARWVRLQRIGGLFVASVGEGGGIWVEIGRVTLGLPAEVMLGLASSAHASDGLVDVRYRDLVNVRGAAVLPPPPANLFAETQSGLVELSWSDTSGGRNGFSVQRREAGGLWQTLGFVGEGAEHYSDASGEAGSSYEYRVAGENSAGIGAYTAPVFALT